MKKRFHIKSRIFYVYIWIWVALLLGIFFYFKIIYFPDRALLKDQKLALSFLSDQWYMDHAQRMNIKDLRVFTGNYVVSSSVIASMERFYAKTHDEKAAVSLLQMYITHSQFDDAFALIKNMYQADTNFSLIPPATFLYILFNSSELSASNYDLIHGIIEDYRTHDRIDNETATFYQWLLDLYKGDVKMFYASVDRLSWSVQYWSFVNAIYAAKSTSKEIALAVPYYTNGLSALVLLREWYFRVAQKRSAAIRVQDTKYILPYQILSEAALLQSHWDEASQYFNTLLTLDASHPSQYHFGLCASYFWLEKYDNALLHCQQVRDKNMPDALRYQLLSYYQIKDWQGMMDTFQRLLLQKNVSENDYYTFFDIIFFQPFVSDKDYSHIQKYYISVVLPYLDQCVSSFGWSSDVCKYGQAWFYLYKNELVKAYRNLLFLASHHPSSYIFRALGEYYESRWDEEKAKAYYLRATATITWWVIDISAAKSWAWNKPMNE